MPDVIRCDAVCCSTRCRQARHRFTHGTGRAAALAELSLRLAYADPPYPGNAHLYKGHPDYAGEVDHAALIRQLVTYDGWALSTSADALPNVLALCPPGVRVAAWVRGERPTRSFDPLHGWEPVIFSPARPIDSAHAGRRRVDTLTAGVGVLTSLPGRVIGAKPAVFCGWMFGLLGAQVGDSLDDLFPGSGAVTRAWHLYTHTTTVVASRPGDGPDRSRFLDDTSPRAGRDASRSRPDDASYAPGRNASPTGPGDASAAAGHDASRASGRIAQPSRQAPRVAPAAAGVGVA
jgi:hypothetical protein